jgi:hypothetical protein
MLKALGRVGATICPREDRPPETTVRHLVDESQVKISPEDCTMTTSLYDTDFDAWAQRQAAALRAKDWAALDIEHLAEEIEDLRKTERNALRSQLRRLTSHLLKWYYQPEKRSESWQATIRDARGLLEDGLETSPSLTGQLDSLLAWAYLRARRQAAKDTGLPLTTFPETCPWNVEQLLDEDFWPDASVSGDPDVDTIEARGRRRGTHRPRRGREG